MANKYSKLPIDEHKIYGWLKIWCEENLEGESIIDKTENSTRILYTITNKTDCIKISFIRCKNGLLTISPNVGNNISISTKIADDIYDRVHNIFNNSPFLNGFSVKLNDDDFEILIELIKTMQGVSCLNSSEQLETGKAKYYLYRFSGPSKDTITIKYYINTKRMQLQGKPLWLFNEVVSMITETTENKLDVVDAQLKYCSVNVQISDIYEEMKSVLGEKLFNFLSETQKAILATSFVYAKIDVQLKDYSSIVHPALRAFEGFTKKVFIQNGINCDSNKPLGTFFEHPDKIMKLEYSKNINEDTEKMLTSMYKFYYDKRHPYSHATAYDFNTTIIPDRKIADELFYEIINSMKSWYYSLVL